MFDFRYHALSLAAVLLALCMGLLLGVAIGDQGLASRAENTLRSDLRGSVEEARGEARELREQIAIRDRYEEQTLPLLVSGRLEGRRVAVLLIGDPDPRTFEHVRDVVGEAGGQVSSVSRLRLPLPLERIAASAEGTRFEQIAGDRELVEFLGRRVGEQIVEGGRLLRDIRPALFATSSGPLGGVDALVVVRAPGVPEEEVSAVEQEFIDAMLAAVRQLERPVAGVELTSTEPSQVGWYEDRDIASIDSVDLPVGRAALVFALAEAADGAYGVKPSRDALLPEAVTRRP